MKITPRELAQDAAKRRMSFDDYQMLAIIYGLDAVARIEYQELTKKETNNEDIKR